MITYLASPYSHPDAAIVKMREAAAAEAAAHFMLNGHVVFSPIAHSHRISDFLPESRRLDHEFWMEQDLRILDSCGLLVVLMLDGWTVSRGVAREIAHARERRIPIVYQEWQP